MKLILQRLLLFFVLILGLACGGSGQFVNTAQGTDVPTATINITQVVTQGILGRNVPTNVTTFRVIGYDNTNTVTFGPQTFNKTPNLSITVPVTTRNVAIQYLDGNGNEVGAFAQPVVLEAGQTQAIVDPAAVFATGQEVNVVLAGNPLHNVNNCLDVNGDGFVSAMDALVIINSLNANGVGPNPAGATGPPFLDVTNNGEISPTDALRVINALNGGTSPCGTTQVTVTPVPASNLNVESGPPAKIAEGGTFPPIVVSGRGTNNATSVDFSGPVTLRLVGAVQAQGLPAGVVLSGTLTQNAVNGLATFPGLSVNLAGTYRLEATSPNLNQTFSQEFEVTAPAGAQRALSVTTAVPTLTAPADLPEVRVSLLDNSGNLVTDVPTEVTLSLTGEPPQTQLGGTLTQVTQNGVAVFTGLTVGTAGQYRLQATAANTVQDLGNTFQVNAPALVATSLSIDSMIQDPLPINVPFANPLVVSVRDQNGDILTTATNEITLELEEIDTAPNPQLLGTTTLNAVNGVATFQGLSITNFGLFEIHANSPGLTEAESPQFDAVEIP